MKKLLNYIIFLSVSIFSQQIDTVKYGWPINPMTLQRQITGTFGEYRSTSTAGHFHNGVDIPGAAGTPVLSVLAGTVAVAYHDGSTGYDSYVRVTSNINGQSKNITYYHCIPTVSVGQVVTIGQQIATIAIDHIHLIDYRTGGGTSSSHLNAIRPDGGLTPYIDTWPPKIRYVKFHLDNSDVPVPNGALGNKIDIIVHVEEFNGTSSSAANNGTYEIGYKILSEDRQTVVYEPPNEGWRYKYYNIPLNAYANINYYRPESNTSKHVYIVTNGNGATNVANSQVVSNNYWDVTQFPYGNYTVMVFTRDTRGNTDTAYVNVTTTDIDLIPPGQPNLKYVRQDSTNYFTIAWRKPTDDDLKGYRMFYSQTGINYSVIDNENVLTNTVESKTYNYSQQAPLFLRLNAVDTSPMVNLSIQSDVYGIRMRNDNKKILIVDGFNRYGGSGSWSLPYHDFIIRYSEAFTFSYESAHNSVVEDGTINLNNYQVVIWILGDESTEHKTFTDAEKQKVMAYLENGGCLFVSGSEIAYDLDGTTSSTTNDKLFIRNYLKAKFVADNSNTKTVVGEAGTNFSGQSFVYGITSLGSPYNEDYPDVIDTVGGSFPILKYDNGTIAGIAYSGTFGSSSNNSKLVYIGFPFETIGNIDARKNFMSIVFNFFDVTLSIADEITTAEFGYELKQNYPNPFNPYTTINFSLMEKGRVEIKVYDILGREVAKLLDSEMERGNHQVLFDGSMLSSGVYICNMKLMNENTNVNKQIKMLLMK